MRSKVPAVDDGEAKQVSRRGILGLVATGTVVGAGGIYGLASMTETAQASADFKVEDSSVVLDVDEEISSAAITGSVEVTYSGFSDPGVGSVGIFLDPQSDADIEFESSGEERWSEGKRYTDVDPDSDTVTHDVSISFDVPPEVGDPEPGEAIETEIEVFVLVQLDEGPEDGDHPGLPILERRVNDAGTLRVEREAEDDDDDDGDNGDDDDDDDDDTEREDNVSGTVTFEVETE